MEYDMNNSASLDEQSVNGQQEVSSADAVSRILARTIDFIIVIALYEILPAVGYLAGLIYLLIADGLFQGRSLGKKLIGLKVIISYNGGMSAPSGFRESIYRNSPFAAGFILFGIFKAIPVIGWLLSFVVVVGVLVFEGLVTLGNEEGLRMGDELAKTRVIEDKQGGLNV